MFPFAEEFRIEQLYCSQKYDDPLENKWNAALCNQGYFDKAASKISYSKHGMNKVEHTFSNNALLHALLNDATLESAIPSSVDYGTLHFTVDSLSDSKHHVICIISKDGERTPYFFLEKWGEDNVIHQCAKSPDGSRIITLISSHSKPHQYELQVYAMKPVAYDPTFQGSMYELEFEIPGVFPHYGIPLVLFNPSYEYSRLALINIKAVHWEDTDSFICTYDLIKKRPNLADHAEEALETWLLMDAVYSPNGELVFVLVLAMDQKATNSLKMGRKLCVYSSVTLKEVQTIDLGFESLGSCLINFLPVFSFCGQHLFVRSKKQVKVIQLPPPRTLQGICRLVVLSNTSLNELEKLTVPKRVKDYLLFKPIQY